MIIDAVIFFLFVAIVIIVGIIIAWMDRSGRKREQLQAVDQVEHEERLSFPQRHWLLICIVVAVVSPLALKGLDAGVHHKLHGEAVEQARDSIGGSVGAPGASMPGNAKATDTSYHVATPPQH